MVIFQLYFRVIKPRWFGLIMTLKQSRNIGVYLLVRSFLLEWQVKNDVFRNLFYFVNEKFGKPLSNDDSVENFGV